MKKVFSERSFLWLFFFNLQTNIKTKKNKWKHRKKYSTSRETKQYIKHTEELWIYNFIAWRFCVSTRKVTLCLRVYCSHACSTLKSNHFNELTWINLCFLCAIIPSFPSSFFFFIFCFGLGIKRENQLIFFLILVFMLTLG